MKTQPLHLSFIRTGAGVFTLTLLLDIERYAYYALPEILCRDVALGS
jgi:hypothetical protein